MRFLKKVCCERPVSNGSQSLWEIVATASSQKLLNSCLIGYITRVLQNLSSDIGSFWHERWHCHLSWLQTHSKIFSKNLSKNRLLLRGCQEILFVFFVQSLFSSVESCCCWGTDLCSASRCCFVPKWLKSFHLFEFLIPPCFVICSMCCCWMKSFLSCVLFTTAVVFWVCTQQKALLSSVESSAIRCDWILLSWWDIRGAVGIMRCLWQLQVSLCGTSSDETWDLICVQNFPWHQCL